MGDLKTPKGHFEINWTLLSGVGVSGKGLGTSTTTAFESESDMVSPKLVWHKIWSFLEFVSALSRDSVSDDDEEEDPDFAKRIKISINLKKICLMANMESIL